MLTIPKLLKKFQELNTDKIIDESFRESSDEFEKKNRAQLVTGQDKQGGKITPRYRNNKYARVKNELNPVPGLGVPDLKVTGAFHRGLRADLVGDTIKIESSDRKNEWLEPKYSGIFGLGGQFKTEFISQDLRPAIHGKISNFTGLKFSTK